MIDFIQTNWAIVISIIALVVGGFYIPGLRSIWVVALRTMLSEKVLIRVFLTIAEKLVKSTKNPLDDIWFEELKKKLLKQD